jgi:iron(III) transport system substrate-binding protein
MYNTDSMTEADMPASILDFAEPEWKGRVAFSPTGADFQAIVSAVLELEGEEATAAWLQGLKDNGVIVQNNLVVMQSVDSGEVDAGIAYHYYWYRDREENGTDSDSSALHFFGDQDPGAFLSISGAGILASSEHQEAAEEFVTWLTGTEAQQAMAESYALEYPLNPDAGLNPDVKPFDELEPPDVDVSSLNGPQVTDLMTEAGLL